MGEWCVGGMCVCVCVGRWGVGVPPSICTGSVCPFSMVPDSPAAAPLDLVASTVFSVLSAIPYPLSSLDLYSLCFFIRTVPFYSLAFPLYVRRFSPQYPCFDLYGLCFLSVYSPNLALCPFCPLICIASARLLCIVADPPSSVGPLDWSSL